MFTLYISVKQCLYVGRCSANDAENGFDKQMFYSPEIASKPSITNNES